MIIPNVTYHSYFNYLPQEVDTESSKILMKLFIKFLKEKKAIVAFYAYFKASHSERATFRMDVRRTNDLVLDTLAYGEEFNPLKQKWEESILLKNTKPRLILCQLWRFYVLDHIEEIPHEKVRNMLVGQLTKSIIANGTRKDKDVEKYFEKYKTLLNG